MRPGDAGGSSRSVPYEDGDIDLIVTKAGGIWFFFGPSSFSKDASVYPASGNADYAGNAGKDMWSLIGL